MLQGYSIIDADSHVIEPPAMWAEYLEPEFRQFAPSPEMKIQGEEIVEKVSKQVRDDANKQMMQAHPNAYFQGYNVESHLQEMVQMGIDVAFPIFLLVILKFQSYRRAADIYPKTINEKL